MTNRYGRPLAYAGGAVLVASFIAGAMSGGAAPVPSPTATEPRLFSFIRDLPETPGSPESGDAGTPDPLRDALPALRQVFDSVLSLHADASADLARMHAGHALKARFAEELFIPGMEVFERYARYHRDSAAIHALLDSASDLAGLRLQLRALDLMRTRYFTPAELPGLFPNDPAYERMLVARMEIRENPALGEQQRLAQLQALEASIPAEVRAVEDLRSRVVHADPRVTDWMVDGEEGVYRMSPAEAPRAARDAP